MDTQAQELGAVKIAWGTSCTTLWLNRPAQRNAINIDLIKGLNQALDMVEDKADELPDVVVLRAAGADFSVGIDLADFPRDKHPDIHGFNKWERLIVRLERLPKATIAVVQGQCLGGGLQLALATDLRVLAVGSTLALPEVGQGFLPGMATWRLAKLLGLARARTLMLTGRPLPVDEAVRLGLAEAAMREAELDKGLRRVIESITPVRQPAWSLARRLLSESYEFSYEDAIGNLLAAQHRAITSPAFLELLEGEK